MPAPPPPPNTPPPSSPAQQGRGCGQRLPGWGGGDRLAPGEVGSLCTPWHPRERVLHPVRLRGGVLIASWRSSFSSPRVCLWRVGASGSKGCDESGTSWTPQMRSGAGGRSQARGEVASEQVDEEVSIYNLRGALLPCCCSSRSRIFPLW